MKLSGAQIRLLRSAAASRDPDGVRFKGYWGRIRAAQGLQKMGLAEIIPADRGLMPRLLISDEGRVVARLYANT